MYWLVAVGIYPGYLGSSGIPAKYWSSFILNSSIVHLVMFLIWAGRQLNNLGPAIWKLFSRRV